MHDTEFFKKLALIYLLYPVVLMVMAALAASRGGDGR